MGDNKEGKAKKSYESRKLSAERFCVGLVEQIKELISQNNITLAVPIESRVKSWPSISSKIERSNLELEDIVQLNDLVGIRLILLFKRDLDRCRGLIEQSLEVVSREDTASRLGESQFGYQSYHYAIRLPKEWLAIPTLKDFAEYQAEIQIRTIAQHIWAAASHNLQYKQEDNVPKTLRRSIYRVSALLETVDLEFERVLGERERYIKEMKPETEDEKLNVDILKEILDSRLPLENREEPEEYSELLQNLSTCGIQRSSQLIHLISERLEGVLQQDRRLVENKKQNYEREGHLQFPDDERAVRLGVYFTHCGLVRGMLDRAFGDWRWLLKEMDSGEGKS